MSSSSRPTDIDVAIVVLNYNGRHHLAPCLESVLALGGLPGPEAVVVADNGSTDGSVDFVRQSFPGVRVLAFDANLGFAAGNNRAAEAVAAEHVLFLNNDARVAPDALAQLWSALSSPPFDRTNPKPAGAVCAGARLLSWDGRRLDFDGGGAAVTGHGHALGYGRPVSAATTSQPHPTLFASGAAMLVHRATFLAAGGFDPDYFAYYEDVDLGWRLWLAGHQVLHVPAAIVFHRHHGTAERLPGGLQARLYERNALATVVKNYDEANLARVLPAALALAALRAREASPNGSAPAGQEVEAWIAGAAPIADQSLPLPPPDWPGWPALAHLDLDFAALARARARVQARRRRPDGEIVPLMVHPYSPVPPTAAAGAALHAAVERFGLAPIFGELRQDESSLGPGAWGRLIERGVDAFRAGGPSHLAGELRGYLAWRRQQAERRS